MQRRGHRTRQHAATEESCKHLRLSSPHRDDVWTAHTRNLPPSSVTVAGQSVRLHAVVLDHGPTAGPPAQHAPRPRFHQVAPACGMPNPTRRCTVVAETTTRSRRLVPFPFSTKRSLQGRQYSKAAPTATRPTVDAKLTSGAALPDQSTPQALEVATRT